MAGSTCVVVSFGLFGLLLQGCGGGSTDPGSDTPPGTQATIHLNLRGLSGHEDLMTVQYHIGSAVLPRSDAAALSPAPSKCTGNGASTSCTISADPETVVTLYAVEYVAGTASPLRGASPPETPGASYEFISFDSGNCQTQTPGLGFGDCAVHVTSAREYTVTANFSVMKQVLFQALGAGQFTVSVQARDVLSMPARPNDVQAAGPGTFNFTVGPSPVPMHVDWFPQGSTVTVVATGINQAKFLRWTGPCGEGSGGGTCTLQEVDNGTTPTATAYFEYWDCGTAGIGDGAAPGCAKVDP